MPNATNVAAKATALAPPMLRIGASMLAEIAAKKPAARWGVGEREEAPKALIRVAVALNKSSAHR